jgi:hypothetical protein
MSHVFGHTFGDGWAQPVVRKRWAFVSTILFALDKWTGYRIDRLAHWKGHAHRRACGV